MLTLLPPLPQPQPRSAGINWILRGVHANSLDFEGVRANSLDIEGGAREFIGFCGGCARIHWILRRAHANSLDFEGAARENHWIMMGMRQFTPVQIGGCQNGSMGSTGGQKKIFSPKNDPRPHGTSKQVVFARFEPVVVHFCPSSRRLTQCGTKRQSSTTTSNLAIDSTLAHRCTQLPICDHSFAAGRSSLECYCSTASTSSNQKVVKWV